MVFFFFFAIELYESQLAFTSCWLSPCLCRCFFSLMWSHLFIVFFVACALGIISKRALWQDTYQQAFTLCFILRILWFLVFNPFRVIFVNGIRQGSSLSFACKYYISPEPFIMKSVFSPQSILGSLNKYVYVDLFLGSRFYSFGLCVCF